MLIAKISRTLVGVHQSCRNGGPGFAYTHGKDSRSSFAVAVALPVVAWTTLIRLLALTWYSVWAGITGSLSVLRGNDKSISLYIHALRSSAGDLFAQKSNIKLAQLLTSIVGSVFPYRRA